MLSPSRIRLENKNKYLVRQGNLSKVNFFYKAENLISNYNSGDTLESGKYYKTVYTEFYTISGTI